MQLLLLSESLTHKITESLTAQMTAQMTAQKSVSTQTELDPEQIEMKDYLQYAST